MLSHNTHISVDGSGVPAEVAKRVERAQERIVKESAAALVREYASVLR
jgi:hypothetical protein